MNNDKEGGSGERASNPYAHIGPVDSQLGAAPGTGPTVGSRVPGDAQTAASGSTARDQPSTPPEALAAVNRAAPPPTGTAADPLIGKSGDADRFSGYPEDPGDLEQLRHATTRQGKNVLRILRMVDAQTARALQRSEIQMLALAKDPQGSAGINWIPLKSLEEIDLLEVHDARPRNLAEASEINRRLLWEAHQRAPAVKEAMARQAEQKEESRQEGTRGREGSRQPRGRGRSSSGRRSGWGAALCSMREGAESCIG